jgi:hypothetical protein
MFMDAFEQANVQETLAGKIVLTIGVWTDREGIHGNITPAQYEQRKSLLDALRLQKVAMADEVLILNVGGYIDESTRKELAHAKKHGRRIRFLEQP